MIAPEFSHSIRVDSLDEAGRAVRIEAGKGELAALARRFGLQAIERLSAEAQVRRRGDVVTAEGRIAAAVVQSCVASGEPVPATIDAPFSIRFVPESADAPDDERELNADDLDTIGYDGASIDLGEAAAETMALELDPFPRSPQAETALRAAGVLSEGEAGPFAALKGLLKG